MRILFITLAAIVSFIGLIMTILPFGTLGVLPGIAAILLGLAAYFFSKKQAKPVKLPLLFCTIGILVVLGSGTKTLWVKDEVAVDQEFEQKEEQTKEDAIEDLKELENDLEEIESE